jgi:hypothetical protein
MRDPRRQPTHQGGLPTESGASATFAMEFTVRPSPKAPIGQQKFIWRLHGFYAGAQAGKVVTVSAS